MAVMVRDREFYARVLRLVVPIALQNIITFSVGLVDNLMVGTLGEEAISGVHIANQFQTILQIFANGMGAALLILGAQYWGKGSRESVHKVVGIGLKLCCVVGLILMGLALLVPAPILSFFSRDPLVVEQGVAYLRVVCPGYLLFCVSTILMYALRCVETVRIGLVVSLVSLVANALLNYCLIFGRLGMPAMGVAGAALATVIARLIELLILLYFVARVDRRLRMTPRSVLRGNGPLWREFMHHGILVFSGELVWGVAVICHTTILGGLGTQAIASASIAEVALSIVSVGAYGMASAAGVIIGQAVGAHQFDLVKQYAKTLQLLFLLCGLVTGAALFCCRGFVISLYNIEPDTVAMAGQFMAVLSVAVVGTSYQMSTATGIIRAGGDTAFVTILNTVSLAVVLVLSLLAKELLGAAPWVVYACLKSDQLFKCLGAFVKANRFRWMREITHTQRG